MEFSYVKPGNNKAIIPHAASPREFSLPPQYLAKRATKDYFVCPINISPEDCILGALSVY